MVERATQSAGTGLGWGSFFAGFVPGLLQARLGQKNLAVAAFASCTVLFFLGWMVVGERLFYWALVTPDSNSSGVIRGLAQFGVTFDLPELLNFPANLIGGLLAFDGTPDGERLWRMPRDFEHVAGWLTAASGMLAAFWAAAGQWGLRWQRDSRSDTPPPVANPALCAGLSWIVPGLGHAKAGQKGKGVLMGVAVVAVFALGLLLSQGHGVDRATQPVWWIGQNLFGGGTLFSSVVTAPWHMTSAPAHHDVGVVLCTVAGLMNLVVMCDAFTAAERSSFPVSLPEGAEVGMPDKASTEAES
jgi:hypothetical protein